MWEDNAERQANKDKAWLRHLNAEGLKVIFVFKQKLLKKFKF